MRTRFLGTLAAAACLNAGVAGAVDLSVLPATTSALIGDTVPVELVVSGLGDHAAPSLGAYDIDLSFDGGVLSLQDVTFGPNLTITGSVQIISPGPGMVNLFELSLDSIEDLESMQPGSFTLATLSFEVTAPGVSALTLAVNSFADAAGNELSVNLVDSAVTAVPEPGSALLMLLGLLSVGLAVRRFRAV